MEDEVRITVRLPREVRDELQKTARADERSLNSEIVYALREFIRSHRP